MPLLPEIPSQDSFDEEISLFGSSVFTPKSSPITDHAQFETKRPISANWRKVQKAVGAIGILAGWRRAAQEGKRTRLVARIIVLIAGGVLLNIIISKMVEKDRKASDLMSFTSYVFVIWLSLKQNGISLLYERKVPLKIHLASAALTTGSLMLSNRAINIGLPVTISLVVKNASLLVTMLVNFLVLQSRFSFAQVYAALLVTLGILRTVMSQPDRRTRTDTQTTSTFDSISPLMLLVASLLLNQVVKLVDNYSSKNHGNHAVERFFYKRVWGMPMLLWNWRNLLNQAWSWSTDKKEDVFGVGYSIPVLWLLGIAVTLMSYVLNMTGWEIFVMSNSVTSSLSLTVQRGISVISIAYLHTPPWPPWEMWFGLANVFVGAVVFTIAPTLASAHDKKNK